MIDLEELMHRADLSQVCLFDWEQSAEDNQVRVWLNAVKAAAWDEGYAKGQIDFEYEAENPYRDEEE